jgi:hypothetical protein
LFGEIVVKVQRRVKPNRARIKFRSAITTIILNQASSLCRSKETKALKISYRIKRMLTAKADLNHQEDSQLVYQLS